MAAVLVRAPGRVSRAQESIGSLEKVQSGKQHDGTTGTQEDTGNAFCEKQAFIECTSCSVF